MSTAGDRANSSCGGERACQLSPPPLRRVIILSRNPLYNANPLVASNFILYVDHAYSIFYWIWHPIYPRLPPTGGVPFLLSSPLFFSTPLSYRISHAIFDANIRNGQSCMCPHHVTGIRGLKGYPHHVERETDFAGIVREQRIVVLSVEMPAVVSP